MAMKAVLGFTTLLMMVGCGTGGGSNLGELAPDFVFIDANPSSPTFGEGRSLHGRGSDVVALYFVSFG